MIESAFRRDAPNGGDLSSGIAELKSYYDGFNDVLSRYCKAVYEITAGSMITAKAQMALMFRDLDGNLVLPGNTCVFKSNGEDIYYGYIRKVEHHLSTAGDNSTMISMSYVRPYESFKINGQEVIPVDSPNAAYA